MAALVPLQRPRAGALALLLFVAAAAATALFATPASALHRPPIGPWRPPPALRQRAAAVAAAAAGSSSSSSSSSSSNGGDDEPRGLLDRCRLTWRNATLDHFSYSRLERGGRASDDSPPGTFPQRVFLCDEWWRRAPADEGGAAGPIFFYLGNEADVTLYLNHTGLMWENAARYGALLVFAEHRYYGASKPFGPRVARVKKHMGYLTAEQALADYAELVEELRALPGAAHSPVVGFGGSYGGMLAAWMRLKYPASLQGAIAASAPIWNFPGEEPPFDAASFARGVTYDATPAAGASPRCAPNVRRAWEVLLDTGSDAGGRRDVARAMRLCEGSEPRSDADVVALRDWLASAWDYLAMGDYPYPSSYMTNGAGALPAYPVRVACGHLDAPLSDGNALLEALARAAGVLYNFTGDLECLSPEFGPSPESDEDANFWDWQFCTEMVMPLSRDGEQDMFWREPFSFKDAAAACNATWGVQPRRRTWATVEWGGRAIDDGGSNIVFSNGMLDPWAGGGVMRSVSKSLVAVVIPEGAHHLDLMFSHALDPPSVTAARRTQLHHISRWVREHSRRHDDQARRLAWWERRGRFDPMPAPPTRGGGGGGQPWSFAAVAEDVEGSVGNVAAARWAGSAAFALEAAAARLWRLVVGGGGGGSGSIAESAAAASGGGGGAAAALWRRGGGGVAAT